jgi:N,N'-diacetyllegionaminate synthase
MNSNKVFIIAEVGVNHNGNIQLAKKLISLAKKIGADAVKFQSFRADKLAFKNTPKVKYQKINSPKKESHYEMLKKLELSYEDHKQLIDYCKKLKIEFISTPYDVESAKILLDCGIKKFKTASADIIDYFLHNFLSKNAKEVIISTGMASHKEISNVISMYKKKTKISLLHCISNYPCSDGSLNLNNIISLNKKFNLPIGFSDHSQNKNSSLVAIGLGARIVERHITLSKKLKGPDHLSSDNPNEFKKYVNLIRNTEKILGTYEKKVQKEEIEMKKISRKGIYYLKNISKGKKIRLNDLHLMRPSTNLSIFEIKNLLKKKLKKNVFKNSALNKNDF